MRAALNVAFVALTLTSYASAQIRTNSLTTATRTIPVSSKTQTSSPTTSSTQTTVTSSSSNGTVSTLLASNLASAISTILSPKISLSPCARVSSISSAYLVANPEATVVPSFPASLAVECLESVPLNSNLSLAFIEYVFPYLQFQSTQAYLKDPPHGWTLDGVDIFGGLEKIAENLQTGVYTNQLAFEKDLYTLVNILPRDFHLNLALPLISIFAFSTQLSLASVSLDGIALPQIYPTVELGRYAASLSNSPPSAIVSINNEPAADYILRAGLQSQQYQDPDAIYNMMFSSLALTSQSNGDAFNIGGHILGFPSENTTYIFANGTTISKSNHAILTVSFDGVDSGTALFEKFETPTSSGAGSDALNATSSTGSSTSQVHGYPAPVIIHSDGYTAGYFLNDSSVAVLVISAFASPSESEEANVAQQTVIRKFLTACKAAQKTQLIIDLQANGGGHIQNGYDAFKQLFPTMEPFGATRFRSTPFVEYLSEVTSNAGVYNYSTYSEFQVQAVVDADLNKFGNYTDFIGPYEIYGDNFTSLMRYNLSDPTIQLPFVISGYYNNTNISPQLFAAHDIIMLFDGTCGSTCAIFSQFMKSQAGVRSIAVGGRPQTGPMQVVGGSKGAEVYEYGVIMATMTEIDTIYQAEGNRTLPPYLGPPSYVPSLQFPPLGGDLSKTGRFNLRNNYNSTSSSEIPLQFVYEAANCRMYYQPSDLVSIVPLWERVVELAWGNGKCVEGSSINHDSSISSGAYDTVPFGPSAVSKICLNSSLPGFVANSGRESAGNDHRTGSDRIGSIIMDMIS